MGNGWRKVVGWGFSCSPSARSLALNHILAGYNTILGMELFIVLIFLTQHQQSIRFCALIINCQIFSDIQGLFGNNYLVSRSPKKAIQKMCREGSLYYDT